MKGIAMIRNKRGSVTIFIMLFMVSLIMMSLAFIREAKNAAVRGSFGALGNLWCDSILAEYDQNLQDRYDIFAFYGLQPEISSKLRFYAGRSVLDKRYVSMSGVNVYLAGHSLMDTDNFRKQIVRAAAFRKAGKLAGRINEFEDHGPVQPRTEGGRALMTDLPSGGTERSVSAASFRHAVENAGSLGNIITESGNRYLEDQYAFMYFKDRSDDRGLGKTYLNSEVEYLITGKKSEEKVEEGIKRKITAVRLVFNTIYAFEDPEMGAEALAAAELITPGPGAEAVRALLLTGWAACESVNDYNLLISGKKVPFYKDKASWALSLESVIKGGIKEHGDGSSPEMKEEVPCVDPHNEHGNEYQDYLKVMLFLMDENVKLLRMMDLIQINMRYCHYADFRVREYSTGLKAVFEVNGGKYSVERSY